MWNVDVLGSKLGPAAEKRMCSLLKRGPGPHCSRIDWRRVSEHVMAAVVLVSRGTEAIEAHSRPFRLP